MKWGVARADVRAAMDQHTTPQPENTPPEHEPKLSASIDTDLLGVSAEELMGLISAGHSDDINELIRRTLTGRHAA